MTVTLEQARTFVAVAEQGTFARAAEKLGKQHTSIVYALKTLEEQTGLKLLDRSGYRSTLTAAGKRVLEHCRRLLSAEEELTALCRNLSGGWEPYLRVVVDGVMPFEPLVRATEELTRQKVSTRIQVFTEFHRGVDDEMRRQEAQIMIALVEPTQTDLEAVILPPLQSLLVAGARHPLVQTRRRHQLDDLRRHTLVTVRGSDPRLHLATSVLDQGSTFHLSDFHAKRLAILDGVGFGWMPKYLIEKDLKDGTLKVVRWEGASEHQFLPRLFHRGRRHLGRAAQLFLDEYLARQAGSGVGGGKPSGTTGRKSRAAPGGA